MVSRHWIYSRKLATWQTEIDLQIPVGKYKKINKNRVQNLRKDDSNLNKIPKLTFLCKNLKYFETISVRSPHIFDIFREFNTVKLLYLIRNVIWDQIADKKV